jgi:D-alanine-D-alanine ligase
MEAHDLSIGLTYDLRDDYAGLDLDEEELAELDRPDTIDALERAIVALGHRVDRVGNLHALAGRVCRGDRWDLVFNIAEGRFGVGRESQVPALLDAYGIAYTFSDPLVSAVTLHKATAKRLLRDQGLPTPGFVVIESAADVEGIELPLPLFGKPVAEGTSKGIDTRSILRTPAELRATCTRLIARYGQAVLVEEFLPGREFTVGVVGTGSRARSVGALEVSAREGGDRDVYTYRNKEECEVLVRYTLVDDETARAAEELALAAWRALDCRDAGRVDLRCDERGQPQILEVNALPGMHPVHSDLPILWQQRGRPYQELVGAIITSACERLSVRNGEPCAS